jgi:flagellin-like protein
MKGLSPLISAILLIAISLAVAGIFSGWFTNFVKTTSKSIEDQGSTKITCANAGIVLENVRYNSTSGNLIGYIRNTDIVALGDIDIEIFLTNATRILLDKNITLSPGEQNSFIYKLDTTDYDFIRARTNCSNVYSQVSSSEVSIIT